MPLELPIFSPTRTRLWDGCALRAHLESTEGWVERTAGKPMVARWLGAGCADAVAVLHQQFMEWSAERRTLGLPVNKDSWIIYASQGDGILERTLSNIASSSVVAQADYFADKGGTLDEDEVFDKTNTLTETLAWYIYQMPLLRWNLQGVEYSLPNHGRSRLDLWGYDDDGMLAIADVKYKNYLGSEYLSRTIEEYREDWQFKHYVWGLSEHLGQPVQRIYVLLLIAAPRVSYQLVPFTVSPESMQMWHKSARQKWADMDAERRGLRIPAQAAVHKDQYGQCPMYRACFEFKLDPALMATQYIKLR